MSDMTPSRGFERIRSALDMIATATVIAAAGAVLALTVWTWNERRVERDINGRQSLAPTPFPLHPPGTPQSISASPTIGAPDATLAVIEYADFQCPYCAQYVRDVWPSIKGQYVDSGKVRFAFKHLPLESHPHSRSTALAAECAHRQGRFSDMRDLLFAKSHALSADSSLEAATRLRLDVAVFNECINGTEGRARIDSDVSSAREIGVQATPWFLVGRLLEGEMVKVERVLVGMTSFESFKTVFDELSATGGTAH